MFLRHSFVNCDGTLEQALWSYFMSQKYCKKINAMVVPWRDGSHVWRKMLVCRDLIEHQIGWNTKMGSSLLWFENWTGLGVLYLSLLQNSIMMRQFRMHMMWCLMMHGMLLSFTKFCHRILLLISLTILGLL